MDAEKGLLEILTEIEKRGFDTGQSFFDTFDRLTKENEDHQFQNDCRSASDVCACSEKNGYPCYRHIDHEYRKLFALNTSTIDRAEKAEAERDDANSRAACWGEEHAKGTADRDRLSAVIVSVGNMLRGMTLDPSIPKHCKEAIEHRITTLDEAIAQTEPLPAHPGCCDICDTGGCCKEESEEA